MEENQGNDWKRNNGTGKSKKAKGETESIVNMVKTCLL